MKRHTLRRGCVFGRPVAAVSLCVAVFLFGALVVETDRCVAAEPRVNILFAIADDWGYGHASIYGDPVVRTPNFDRIAREGLLFTHAFCDSPSCAPSRAAILTGQHFWRLASGANLYGTFADHLATYPELLAAYGYQLGVSQKGWGPGRTARRGRQLIGPRYESFAKFLQARDPQRPFCYWLGSGDPHRDFELGSGERSGMDLAQIRLPRFFPDVPTVRGDVADYYVAVQRFDAMVGEALAALDAAGLVENTLIVITSDHGMPFPRAKSNIYDAGMRVPLAIRLPGSRSANSLPRGDATKDDDAPRVVDAFVNLTDMAPTFLEVAGLAPPARMTGRSLWPLLDAAPSNLGTSDAGDGNTRTAIFFGKERHVPSQAAPDGGGYPCRAIRTREYLYIRNYRPDRWPAGQADYRRSFVPGGWYADCDNGPTKRYMIENRELDPQHARLYELSFGKRPAEELYVLADDPEQMMNVAAEANYAEVKQRLAAQLTAELIATGDPREVGGGERFDREAYWGGAPLYRNR
ncbi:MAG: heparan N-sulfatase [Planctomycetota bacterium]|nr:MAG: heparan N-sulfatase [Planctomycetota bacterium]REK37836.1 MAG: heparan N-sulfatase [Planctomycetota bacterium]